jgi:hypothetical protein
VARSKPPMHISCLSTSELQMLDLNHGRPKVGKTYVIQVIISLRSNGHHLNKIERTKFI